MNIVKINNVNQNFKGLLTIAGPVKDSEVTINTDNVAAILKAKHIDKKEDSVVGVGFNEGAVVLMNNGMSINTFLPTETVIDAYKKAKEAGSYKVESKFNPVLSKPLLSF